MLIICSIKFSIESLILLKDWIKIRTNLELASELQSNFLENECDNELEKLKELENVAKYKEVKINQQITIPKS